MSTGNHQDPRHEEIRRAVEEAGSGWAEAMRTHKLAPPDAGFAARLRGLSEAASREQVAWRDADASGLAWRPVPGAEQSQPPYELRPGTGRRGPVDLWERFDASVARLNRAIAGSDARVVADGFGALADAARELADAVGRQGDAAAGAESGRIRGAA